MNKNSILLAAGLLALVSVNSFADSSGACKAKIQDIIESTRRMTFAQAALHVYPGDRGLLSQIQESEKELKILLEEADKVCI